MKKVLDLQNGIIYGPLISRRLGRSLGLNLLPTTFKLCSMNCCYCQYGWAGTVTTEPGGLQELPTVEEVASAIELVLAEGCEFDYLTFSGNGEATLHPDFAKIVDIVLELRKSHSAEFKLAMLSNSTTAGNPALKNAFEKIDLPIMKLDAGNEAMFRQINRCASTIKFADILSGIKSLKNVVIQSMFVQGSVNNSSEEEVDCWIRQLDKIMPLWVQIYSLDRGTADKGLEVVEQSRLKQIADQVKTRTGIRVEVY